MEVRRSIDLDVDVERAWAALTEPDGLEAWLGGPSSLELVPGGLGVLRHGDGSVHLAEVEAVEPGRRLVLRWVPASADDGPATRVELTVERLGAHSRVTVVETPLAAAGSGRPDDAAGSAWAEARGARWDARLARLEARPVTAALAVTRSLDDVFAVLADPTRRQLLRRLATDGPTTATVLARELPITRQAVVKHLQALQQAGLVEPARHGREVRYSARSTPLEDAAGWLADAGVRWDERLERLRRHASAVRR